MKLWISFVLIEGEGGVGVVQFTKVEVLQQLSAERGDEDREAAFVRHVELTAPLYAREEFMFTLCELNYFGQIGLHYIWEGAWTWSCEA